MKTIFGSNLNTLTIKEVQKLQKDIRNYSNEERAYTIKVYKTVNLGCKEYPIMYFPHNETCYKLIKDMIKTAIMFDEIFFSVSVEDYRITHEVLSKIGGSGVGVMEYINAKAND